MFVSISWQDYNVSPISKYWIDQQVKEESGKDVDPVTLLWRLLRKGKPFLALRGTLYPTALSPPGSLGIPERASDPKRNTLKFLEACIDRLAIPAPDLFTISDLFSDDTTGFVKVKPP